MSSSRITKVVRAGMVRSGDDEGAAPTLGMYQSPLAAMSGCPKHLPDN